MTLKYIKKAIIPVHRPVARTTPEGATREQKTRHLVKVDVNATSPVPVRYLKRVAARIKVARTEEEAVLKAHTEAGKLNVQPAALTEALATIVDPRCYCSGCNAQYYASEILPVWPKLPGLVKISKSLKGGDKVPMGRCPDCKEFMYPHVFVAGTVPAGRKRRINKDADAETEAYYLSRRKHNRRVLGATFFYPAGAATGYQVPLSWKTGERLTNEERSERRRGIDTRDFTTDLDVKLVTGGRSWADLLKYDPVEAQRLDYEFKPAFTRAELAAELNISMAAVMTRRRKLAHNNDLRISVNRRLDRIFEGRLQLRENGTFFDPTDPSTVACTKCGAEVFSKTSRAVQLKIA